jgi:hypothetical protein
MDHVAGIPHGAFKKPRLDRYETAAKAVVKQWRPSASVYRDAEQLAAENLETH